MNFEHKHWDSVSDHHNINWWMNSHGEPQENGDDDDDDDICHVPQLKCGLSVLHDYSTSA